MQYLKSGSSIVLRKEFASEIKAFLWGVFSWADGYFVETIGNKNESIIKAYLDSQQTKHS
jgi:REP element-mobilizing transposase RayT